MKILLIGEYSNVHWTLAEGLRALGHQVTVLSNGDFWKNYPRDLGLVRDYKLLGGLRYMLHLLTLLPSLRGFDVVQLINPMFLEMKAERILPIYKYLHKHNKKLFLGAFGMDYYWVHENICRKPLRYSDFNIGNELRTDNNAIKERKDWIGTSKEKLNEYIANDCDGIIAGLYEYLACYQPLFPHKTTFIPYPIKCENKTPNFSENDKVRIFLGINKERSEYKGTDIMLKAAQAIVSKYPTLAELKIAESVPFAQYQKMMSDSDVILDQLYSYTPAMNALEAMSQGIIVVGGGEPENYEILHENKIKPIINVEPNYESVYHELEQLVLHKDRIQLLKEQSVTYIQKHHDYLKVAKQYEKFYGLEENIHL
jgi:glycosyltransferase involved in cell wall biosynthesis